jgi:hypothetical protein
VRLQRVRPFSANSFKPWFVGCFIESGGRVVLVGRFTMHLWAKAFMCFWLGFCLLWTIGAAVAVALQPDAPRFLPLAGMGMVAFGIALVAFAKSLSRDDVVWLSDVIKRALNSAA